jgi:hypothetical protein
MKGLLLLALVCAISTLVNAQSPFAGVTTNTYNGSLIKFYYDENGSL